MEKWVNRSNGRLLLSLDPRALNMIAEVKTIMVDAGSIVMFTIVSFSLAIILIMKKDTIPPQLKRYMAIIAIVFVCTSFFLILYSLMTAF